jgi:hypothetical protein
MENSTPKPSRLKKVLRRTVFVLAVLVTLVALLIAEENWRGNRAWLNYKSAMEAKGERFDGARLIPPKVPDDENFAACEYLNHSFAKSPARPEWTDLNSYLHENFDLPRRCGWPYGLSEDLAIWAAAYQGGAASGKLDPAQAAAIVFDHLKVCQPVLAELRAASHRRYCRFNVPYEVLAGPWNQKTWDSTVQHLALVKGLFRVLALHAAAELAIGQTGQAQEDVNMMFRLEDGLKEEPLLMSQLVCYASIPLLLKPVAEGLAERRWSDGQLRSLQEQLSQMDLLASTFRVFYGERDLLANPFFRSPIFMLRGWGHLEQLNINRAFQEALLPRIDLADREVSPTVGRACDLAMTNYPQGVGGYIHHSIMATMLLPSFFRAPQHAAVAQTDVDLLTVACALERYRLAEGHYPDQLAALSPRFISTLPHDIINGQPLKYRRNADGKFVLYSIGWNEKDDGGVTATNKDGGTDRLRGDWVLEYPN